MWAPSLRGGLTTADVDCANSGLRARPSGATVDALSRSAKWRGQREPQDVITSGVQAGFLSHQSCWMLNPQRHAGRRRLSLGLARE